MASQSPRPRSSLFVALSGTTVGSFVWGWLADIYGRRVSILLSTILFVSTAICGAMPSYGWNLVMCFLMGCSAGGMLPVVYTLLAEVMPPKHRGWVMVLVGGTGLVGGYLAAENYALGVRGRATGLIAASSKFGGVAVQLGAFAGLIPTLGGAALALLFPMGLSAVLIGRSGRETQGRSLRDLEAGV